MRGCLLGAFLLLTSLAFADEADSAKPKAITATKVNELKITLDGKLTEPVWQQQPISDFTQRDPNEGKAASELTKVWIAYDDANLYVAAKLMDSKPDEIDASLFRRDSYVKSDWFSFYVDPYNDKKSGFFFYVNAGGSKLDGTLFNDSWDDNSWNGIWDTKTSIENDGWTVEMQIPFSQLRFKEADVMKWGVNFSREIKRNNERDYFVMVPKKESGFVSKFAMLEGLVGVKPKQRFEIIPYVVQKSQFLVHDSQDPFYKSNQYKTTLGADVKLGIGSNLNLDATINPDFGQVEVDPAVINLSAFESYFEEKRPFFIEGNDLFYFGIGGINNNWGFNFGWPELFYSRRIGSSPHGSTSDADYTKFPSETRILGAAKLTGKINESFSIAALGAATERTYATLYNSGIQKEEEVEPLSYYGVVRAKKEFEGGNQAIGFMFTGLNRSLNDSPLKTDMLKNAYAYGVDGWTFLDKDKEYAIAGAVAGTYVSGSKEALQNIQQRAYRYYQRPDASFATMDSSRTSLGGYYARVMLNKQKGNFYINSAIGIVSPGFEQNDVGFQWMADRINAHTVIGYRWFEPDSLFRNKFIYVSHARSYNFDGNIISNFLWFNSGGTFTNYYGLYIGGNYSFETNSVTATRGGPLILNPQEWNLWISANSDNRKPIIVNANTSYGKDLFGGYYINGNLSVEWRPNTKLSLSIGPDYTRNLDQRQWVDNFDDVTATATYKTRYVFACIDQHTFSANIRLNWTFTPSLSFQLFMQPFFAVGKYSQFKEVAKPRTLELNRYGENGSTISYNSDNEEYSVDPDGNGPAQKFSFDNPDFNYKSLRGTAVLRYEFLPGSIFYFVWSHNQSNEQNPGDFNFGRDFKNLWGTAGDDIIMAKFTYWLDI
jgi:hypothetical protein